MLIRRKDIKWHKLSWLKTYNDFFCHGSVNIDRNMLPIDLKARDWRVGDVSLVDETRGRLTSSRSENPFTMTEVSVGIWAGGIPNRIKIDSFFTTATSPRPFIKEFRDYWLSDGLPFWTEKGHPNVLNEFADQDIDPETLRELLSLAGERTTTNMMPMLMEERRRWLEAA